MRRAICLLWLLGISVTLNACSMVSGTRKTDGTLVVTSWRFLWKSEAIQFSASQGSVARAASDVSSQREETHPFTVTLRIGKSTTDAEATAAVAQAIVAGAMKGGVP